MKKYNFKFTGHQAGAIGITYPISDTYKAKDIHEAMSLLYTDYDTILGLRITENGKQIEQPEKINWVTVRPHSERQRTENGSYLYTRSDSPISK